MAPDPVVIGKFQLKSSENFEEFMSALGIGYLTRKLGNKSSPVVTVSQNEEDKNVYTFKQESLVSTSQFSFKFGQQFDEKTADGRKVKSTMTVEKPNILRHEMLGTNGGKDSVCVREFFKDKMKCVCTVDEIVTTRMYERK